jgi:HlyD family secretion protein
MDKPISYEERRHKRNRRLAIWLLAGAGAVALTWALLRSTVQGISTADLTIATVETGDVLQTLTASGSIIPAFEYTINAPVITEIKSIYLSNGATVAAGNKILELDQEFTALEYQKLQDELLLKKNNIDKLKLQYDKELKDLEHQFTIKGLQINETDAQIKAQIRLKNVGGAAQEDIDKARLQLTIMQIEKEVLQNDLSYRKKLVVLDRNNLELEYEIQAKRLAELRRKLNETTVRAEKSGVITWINEDLGKTVQVGEPLVRVADLQRFRVEAITSDRNLQWLKPGTPVIVRINRQDLNGTISHTLPAIENNSIKFHVALQQPDHEALRPNLRADVYIVTAERHQTRRLRVGPAMTTGSQQDMYVVRQGVAQKVQVTKGLTNPDYVEIAEGLQPGDRVIISGYEKMKNAASIKLKP